MANGAEWYRANTGRDRTGSLKDFSYLFTNALEISVSVSCCKFPEPFFLGREWAEHQAGLLQLLDQAHTGLRGLVTLEGRRPQQGAEILVWKAGPGGSRVGKVGCWHRRSLNYPFAVCRCC